jgi:mevalonate kinase
VDPVLESIGALVERAGGLLGQPEALGEAMDENHALLRLLGVSTPALDDLCGLARAHGALGAKLSGSGGGGVVVALVAQGGEARLLRAACDRGIPALCARLGAD